MAGSSTLDLPGEQPPETNLGHGTRVLGPSDTSDSGSDIAGGPGTGLTGSAGRDIGDSNLDSDTDSTGTGERGALGRDTAFEPGSDIAPDRILDMVDDDSLVGTEPDPDAEVDDEDTADDVVAKRDR
jgi:hypothetical protein